MITDTVIIMAMGITTITTIKGRCRKLGLLPPPLEGWGGGFQDRVRMSPPSPSPASGGGDGEALAFADARRRGAMQ
jgi:hypothetical protein